MEDVGHILKQRRQELGLSLEDVASILKIRPSILNQMEEGHPSNHETYNLLFVKSYAIYLGFEGDEILEHFRNKFPATDAPLMSPIAITEVSRPNIWMIAGSLIALVGIIYFFSNSNQEREEEISILSQEAPLHPSLETPGEKPSVASPEVPAPSPAPQEEAPSETPSVDPSARPSLQKPSAETSFEEETKPLTIHALEDSWINVLDGEGRSVFNNVLQKGETYTVPKLEKATLHTGNAGGLIFLQGDKRSDPLGKKGEVKKGVDILSVLKDLQNQ